ncbi:MAG: hypothetical protein RLZZ187_1258 [Pseudomonadota bacterium]
MSPQVGAHGRQGKARGWRGADQARPALLAVLALSITACSDRWSELDPRPVVANIFGAHLEGREPPPGLDQPWPNLSSVPARPEPPDAATRARLSDGLAQDRAASREALQPGGRSAVGGAPPAPGAAPPPPPRLAAMPPPRPAAPLGAPPAQSPAAAPAPAAPAAALAVPPAAPPADLLAPPPPPAAELLAPRPN